MKKAIIIAFAAALGCVAPLSLQQTQNGLTLALDSAEARIGRPLSPGSIAGVNRRVHRRAYRHAAYGAVAYGAAYNAYPYAYHGRAGYRRHCTCY